ncbi:MFS transporter [Sphingomonas sp. BK235]|uniref:MFS transporter n=1 Tax=Sphingomonas sp. BK235 TaxID=2512131 RepID=UPI001044D1F2|nr:MFS transporter [Sphingomonas sp. BK235]TCP37405.1 fucose permease [Sphingomonas sp. BK235]
MSGSARFATRLSFLVAGFGIACWAPLVPIVKERLAIDDATLGLLLLCIGAGSVVAMIATGPLSARLGSRPIIMSGGVALALLLPLLPLAGSATMLAGLLLLFGAALGSLDVAMNIHAVEVERSAARPLMSGFHALFSVGGFAGASAMTLFLTARVAPALGAAVCAALMLATMLVACPRLLRTGGAEEGPLLAVPRGAVLLLALLALVTFLVEGAMLDWGALLIAQRALVAPDRAGLGYILFSVAMTAGRFAGDAVITRWGERRTIAASGTLTVLGFALLLLAPTPTALGGFVLIGLGAANVVPVLFRRAGAQTVMPAPLAIGAVTTLGYAGVLVGPAAIGFVADAVGLVAAFWLLALLMLAVPLSAARVARMT